MTGTELFEALSFVDEKYIQEAETANLGRNTPWMKVVSVAACLCILLTGVYAYSQIQSKSAMESMAEPEAAVPEAAYEEAAPAEAPAATEAAAAAAPKEEVRSETGTEDDEAVSAAGELEQIPFARLEIMQVLEEGKFTVVVDATDEDFTSLEVGMELTLVVDPSKIPGGDAEIQNDLSGFTVYSLAVVENGAYDAGTNTLYAQSLIPDAME